MEQNVLKYVNCISPPKNQEFSRMEDDFSKSLPCPRSLERSNWLKKFRKQFDLTIKKWKIETEAKRNIAT